MKGALFRARLCALSIGLTWIGANDSELFTLAPLLHKLNLTAYNGSCTQPTMGRSRVRAPLGR